MHRPSFEAGHFFSGLWLSKRMMKSKMPDRTDASWLEKAVMTEAGIDAMDLSRERERGALALHAHGIDGISPTGQDASSRSGGC